jgi:cell wall-associated NlpC family hydrolase
MRRPTIALVMGVALLAPMAMPETAQAAEPAEDTPVAQVTPPRQRVAGLSDHTVIGQELVAAETPIPAPEPDPVVDPTVGPTVDPAEAGIPQAAEGTAVTAYALQFLGTPYVWGGTTPAGFDCSGFTQYVYAHLGVSLPRVDTAQHAAGHDVALDQAMPGDLVWKPGHVGIYLGDGLMIHAPKPGDVVKVSRVSDVGMTTAVRVG